VLFYQVAGLVLAVLRDPIDNRATILQLFDARLSRRHGGLVCDKIPQCCYLFCPSSNRADSDVRRKYRSLWRTAAISKGVSLSIDRSERLARLKSNATLTSISPHAH
jgi:hypothetical protein